jgi:predicted nicotinamide N-methyase
VLELGCGLGLVGVAAAMVGADVLGADQSAEAIAFTAVNAERNGVAVRTVRCAFERPEPVLSGAPWDLVLAADVLYEPKTVPVLVDLLPRLGRAVWLADPGRPREPDFLRAVDAAGWRRQSRVVTPQDALPRVSIHRLHRLPG